VLRVRSDPFCSVSQRILHPQHPAYSAFAYSPGFALVDFFWFGRVKEEESSFEPYYQCFKGQTPF
jgi:hypothetical protein